MCVLSLRIGGVRRHDAAKPEVLDADQRLADAQAAARPRTLVEILDPLDHDVGAQATVVVAECMFDGGIILLLTVLR
ncbi:MAG: hypothetical protein IPQ07_33440 [Myxococcales bacterium]|nr:hypothetical protein [Myxococcales bacterium]